MKKESTAWHPDEDAGESTWAHGSGWMQLGCERRCVSCVVPTCHHEREITPWLGVLIDPRDFGDAQPDAVPMDRGVYAPEI